jgi:hypothetical protein
VNHLAIQYPSESDLKRDFGIENHFITEGWIMRKRDSN